MTISAGLAVAASLLYLARLLPQPLRTLRTGEVAGVSGLASMNALIADGAWLLYGLAAGVVPVWLVAVPSVAASALTVVVLRRTIRARDVVLATAWLAAVTGCALGHVLTVALAATVVVTCGPALWTAYAHRRPAGVAPATWWLAVADAATWGGYGTAIGDRALELYGVVQLATAVAILVRLRVVAGRPPAAATANATATAGSATAGIPVADVPAAG